MRYVTMYMPSGDDDDVEFFSSEEEAWHHIETNHICPSCLESLRPEGVLDPEGKVERESHVGCTGCGAEWDVASEEDWERWNESFDDRGLPVSPFPSLVSVSPVEIFDEGEFLRGTRVLHQLEVRSNDQGICIVARNMEDSVVTLVQEFPEDGNENEIRRRFLDAVDGFYEVLMRGEGDDGKTDG